MRKLIAVLGVALAACSSSADLTLAAQEIPSFHKMLDAAQFEKIYADASDDLKRASKKEDFVPLLEAVHRKLGNFKSGEQKNWGVTYQSFGAVVTLNYAAVYAEGTAMEQFVYRIVDNKALLAGYWINSTALVLK